MLFNLYFHQMDYSRAFERFISDKLDHLKRHFPNLVNVKFVVDKNNGALNKFAVKMFAKLEGREVCLHSNNKDIYHAANELFRKLKAIN